MTQQGVREIALSLPGAEEGVDTFAFFVTVKEKHKGFVWSWKGRRHPKRGGAWRRTR